MRTLKRIVGWMLVAAPFVVVTAKGIADVGLAAMLTIWGVIALTIAIIYGGICLITTK